jgi:kumamolisin
VVKTFRRRHALVVAGSVESAERAFSAPLVVDPGDGRRRPARAPRLPAWMPVRGVLGLGDGPRIRPLARPRVAVPGGEPALAPADVTLVYGIAALHAQGYDGTGSSIAVLGRSNVSDADLAAFAALYLGGEFPPLERLFTRPGEDPGPGDPLDAIEAVIDTQWAGAVAPGAALRLMLASPGDDIPEALLTAVADRVADVLSISFGLCEPFADRLLAEFFDDQYAQALRQGQTVLVSAGDGGATDCAPASPVLAVNALASSSHAVAVGGTVLDPLFDESGNATGYGGESAWRGGGGGGSLFFARPSYQDGLLPLAGRMLPDVSLAAAPSGPGYVIVRGGQTVAVGGTSVGAPIVAALVAIANQRAGRSVGAVLPALYAAASDEEVPAPVRDVLAGSNGYPASEGFDLATGLGSPLAEPFTAALAAATSACEPLWPCLVPGRPLRRACLAGWKVSATPLATRRDGVPKRVQTCRDGAPSCDLDGLADGRCVLEVSLCLNGADPRLSGCAGQAVDRVRLRAPARGGAGAADRARLEASLARLPDLPTDLREACGAPARVEIPLGRRGRAGRRVLRASVRSGGRGSRAVVKLKCLPTQ